MREAAVLCAVGQDLRRFGAEADPALLLLLTGDRQLLHRSTNSLTSCQNTWQFHGFQEDTDIFFKLCKHCDVCPFYKQEGYKRFLNRLPPIFDFFEAPFDLKISNPLENYQLFMKITFTQSTLHIKKQYKVMTLKAYLDKYFLLALYAKCQKTKCQYY